MPVVLYLCVPLSEVYVLIPYKLAVIGWFISESILPRVVYIFLIMILKYNSISAL